MIRSLEHATDLIAKRRSLGKKGLPKSVRRWLKRQNKDIVNKLIDNASLTIP